MEHLSTAGPGGGSGGGPGGGPVGGPGGGPGNGAGNGPGFVGPGFGLLVIFLEKFMLVSLMMDFVGIISFTHCLVPFLIFSSLGSHLSFSSIMSRIVAAWKLISCILFGQCFQAFLSSVVLVF